MDRPVLYYSRRRARRPSAEAIPTTTEPPRPRPMDRPVLYYSRRRARRPSAEAIPTTTEPPRPRPAQKEEAIADPAPEPDAVPLDVTPIRVLPPPGKAEDTATFLFPPGWDADDDPLAYLRRPPPHLAGQTPITSNRKNTTGQEMKCQGEKNRKEPVVVHDISDDSDEGPPAPPLHQKGERRRGTTTSSCSMDKIASSWQYKDKGPRTRIKRPGEIK